MDVRTEFLPIQQDFVPCRGRCPATLCDFTTSKKQGKGTADLMMPFGVLFEMHIQQVRGPRLMPKVPTGIQRHLAQGFTSVASPEALICLIFCHFVCHLTK